MYRWLKTKKKKKQNYMKKDNPENIYLIVFPDKSVISHQTPKVSVVKDNKINFHTSCEERLILSGG